MPNRSAVFWQVMVVGYLLCSCGVVRMPFRVAGSVVQTTYKAGKNAANSSARALEQRRLRKEAETKAREPRQGDSSNDSPAPRETPEIILPQPTNEPLPLPNGPLEPIEEPMPLPDGSLPPLDGLPTTDDAL